MILKKLISYFLILVLCIQVLPLQQVAAWLSSGQVTEEIAHDLDGAKSKSQFGKDAVLSLQSFHAGSQALSAPGINRHPHDETLMIRDADEILIPPPNE
ncbi:MAG TPA: hypothetical protein VGH64_11915 [Puia sp.]|jgi:hypothetical protein